MLRLAICDDEARCRERIASLVAEYGRARGCALSAESFSGAAQLLDSGGRFDIYLLDILMEKTMETARLLLRPLTMDDAADVFDYSRNCEVGPSAGWKPHESLEETKTILREQFVGRQDVFGIVLKQTGRVIGIIALLPDPRRKNERARMVDCALAREYWCSGYMFILILSVALVFTIAAVLFCAFAIAEVPFRAWLFFIYALPVAAIVCIVFTSLWWSILWQTLSITVLIWTAGLCLYLSLPIPNLALIFVVCAAVQVLTVLWELFRKFKRK